MNTHENISVAETTKLLTTDGYVNVETLVDTPSTFWYKNKWVKGVAFKHHKPSSTYLICFSDGGQLIAAEDHTVTMSDNTNIPIKDIQINDQVFSIDYPVMEGYNELDVEQAYIYGYNFLTASLENGVCNKRVTLSCGLQSSSILHDLNSYAAEQRFKLLYTKLQKEPSYKPDTPVNFSPSTSSCLNIDDVLSDVKFTFELHNKITAYKYIDYTSNVVLDSTFTARSRMAWLAGVLDSLGTVVKDVLYINYNNPVQLYQIKKVLSTLGCGSYVGNTSDIKYILSTSVSDLVDVGVPFLLLDSDIITTDRSVRYKSKIVVTDKQAVSDIDVVTYGIKQLNN